MLLNVNPTRMELLRLKERYLLAKKGHKLLKEKLEGLMRNFLDVAGKYIKARKAIDSEFIELQKEYYMSISGYSNEEIDALLLGGTCRATLKSVEKSVMNVRYPEFSVEEKGIPYAYPLTLTNIMLDNSFDKMRNILKKVVELSYIEEELYLVAREIAKTRRRVNALEYIMIPDLEETIKYITNKLEEMDRENIARLLKMKDIIRGH
jgi:V/A-type H+-transporting ATPase subunit D